MEFSRLRPRNEYDGIGEPELLVLDVYCEELRTLSAQLPCRMME
jgi:hypothetical protein